MSDSAAAPIAPPPSLQRKFELEAALQAVPEDAALRAALFDELAGLAAGHTGLFWASLPEVGAPLALRAGTADCEAFTAVFRDGAMALPLRAQPTRILIIGGYAGYTAVALALRWPGAAIAVVEPLADNLRLLRMNTAPWPGIQVLPAAAWHSATTLSAQGRLQGDWIVRMTDEAADDVRLYPARTVRDLLAEAGWDHADMIVCDANGAEREVFADPLQGWLDGVDTLLVALAPAAMADGTAAVERAFPEARFERAKAPGFDVFSRRQPRTLPLPGPPPRRLIHNGPGRIPFGLSSVPVAPWGFHIFDGTSFQLHPNGVAGQPSRAVFAVSAPGYTRFVAGIRHDGVVGAYPIQFKAFVVAEDTSVVAQTAAVLTSQSAGRLSLAVPAITPPYRVVLQCEMAEGAPHLQMAWARWIDPVLS